MFTTIVKKNCNEISKKYKNFARLKYHGHRRHLGFYEMKKPVVLNPKWRRRHMDTEFIKMTATLY